MQLMIPFLVKKVKTSDPELYEQIVTEPAIENNGKLKPEPQ
jgi:hypothetical protein